MALCFVTFSSYIYSYDIVFFGQCCSRFNINCSIDRHCGPLQAQSEVHIYSLCFFFNMFSASITLVLFFQDFKKNHTSWTSFVVATSALFIFIYCFSLYVMKKKNNASSFCSKYHKKFLIFVLHSLLIIIIKSSFHFFHIPLFLICINYFYTVDLIRFSKKHSSHFFLYSIC